jgi:hypothetical protein
LEQIVVSLTQEEFDAVTYALEVAYERAMEGYTPRSRGSDKPSGANEPTGPDSPEDGEPTTPPRAEVLKTILDRLNDAWLQ